MRTQNNRFIDFYIMLWVCVYIWITLYHHRDFYEVQWYFIMIFATTAAIFDTRAIILPSGESFSLVIPLLFSTAILYNTGTVFLIVFLMFMLMTLSTKRPWRLNLFKSVQYGLSTFAGLYAYQWFGGSLGDLDIRNAASYLAFILLYFTIHLLLQLGFNFMEKGKSSAIRTIPYYFEKNSLLIFFTMMTLGVMLTIIMESEGLLGGILSCGVIGIMGVSYRNYYRMYENLKQVNEAYEKFVPSQFLRLLNKRNITEVELGNQVKTDMTILFSDIRSFTSLSEKLTPEENFKFLNSYLNQMEPIVKSHQGFIDKYIGDGIMALFHNQADDAVRAAISMILKLYDYNEGREKAGYTPIDIGIGINTGPMILGIVGGFDRMESTVISDAVNLSSRLEGMNKIYRTRLLISDKTYQSLQNPTHYLIRMIDKVKVKGKSESTFVYEVFDADLPDIKKAKRLIKEPFEEAFSMFQNHAYDAAKQKYMECLSIYPDDFATQLHIKRCDFFLKNIHLNPDDISIELFMA